MAIVTIEPRDELKHVIRQFWYTTIESPSHSFDTFRILSDGAPGIIFQHYNGRSSVLSADGFPLPISFVYGQSTSPCINHIADDSFIFGVNFQPTAFKSLFSIDTSELTDSILDTEYLFPLQFKDQLLNASNPKDIIQLFSEHLSQQIVKYKQDKVIDTSISLIMQKTTEVDSTALSSYFNISRRQFQRRFKEYAGVSPENYIRIIKFQKSIHLLQDKQYEKLSDIGYGLNYADQSHFGREFKLFSGYTPKEFLKSIATPQPFLQNNSYSLMPLRIVRG